MLVRVLLVPLLGVYTWLAWGYASATPPWNNPDEPAHYNYVAYVARTGQLPVLQPGDWDAAQLERLKAARFPPDQPIDAIRYESWQPPLYYLVAAHVLRVLPSSGQPERVLWLRGFDVALGGLTVLVGYLIARAALVGTGTRRRAAAEVVPVPVAAAHAGRSAAPVEQVEQAQPVIAGDKTRARATDEWLALAAGSAMVGVPMFTAMSAAITNDALANLVASLLTLASLHLLRQTPGPRAAVGLGVLCGLALLTKLTLAVFVVLALLALLVGPRGRPVRRASSVVRTVTAAGVCVLVLAPWLLRQALTYGWTDLLASRRHESVVVDQPRFPGLSLDFATSWSTTVFHSFWAQFGWMGVPAPDRLFWVWGLASALGLVGLLVWLLRRRAARWRSVAVAYLALTALAMLAALVGYNLTFVQPQGRYLFPALAPFATLLVLGWSALSPRPLRALAPLLLALALIALNAYTLSRVLTPAFA